MQVTTPTANALSRYLDLSALELKLTAQNMANIDTPGYRTVGFDFAAEMGHFIDSREEASSVFSGEHRFGAVQTAAVGGLLERPDGNDVSMDREGIKMAEAQLQFRAGAELLKREFTRVIDAIREGQK